MGRYGAKSPTHHIPSNQVARLSVLWIFPVVKHTSQSHVVRTKLSMKYPVADCATKILSSSLVFAILVLGLPQDRPTNPFVQAAASNRNLRWSHAPDLNLAF
jgi:hypothetical protein